MLYGNTLAGFHWRTARKWENGIPLLGGLAFCLTSAVGESPNPYLVVLMLFGKPNSTVGLDTIQEHGFRVFWSSEIVHSCAICHCGSEAEQLSTPWGGTLRICMAKFQETFHIRTYSFSEVVQEVSAGNLSHKKHEVIWNRFCSLIVSC